MNDIATKPEPTAPQAISKPTREARAKAPPPVLANSLLNFVARAMADPSVNVEKLEVLLRMQREIVEDDARLQFNRAMSTAQGEMQPVLRDAANTQTNSRYARLETIDAAIRPIYVRNGFCLTFNSEANDNSQNERIVCEVSHAAGFTKRYQLDAPLDTAGARGNANKTPLHGLGSTISYLRRYLTCMVFNIVLANDDNDGNRQRDHGDGEVVGRAPIAELRALIAECSADPTAHEQNERTFLTRMGLGQIRTIADAPVADFPRLKNALLTKKGVLAERAQAKTNAANANAINGAAA